MIQRFWAFARDVLSAIACSTLGGPVGFLLFLGVASLSTGGSPKRGDYRLLPYSLIIGLLAGLIPALVLRAFGGPIKSRWLSAFGFFLLGAVAGPLILVAMMAYAFSHTGGW